jgi:predicted O-methyltransferase YrrM
MYSHLQLGLKYLSYWIKASNGKGHGIHSPFVYDFVVNVLKDPKQERPKYQHIEKIREAFKNSDDRISILDLGAGSAYGNDSKRSVSSLVKNAAKPSKFGRLFHRLVKYYGIETVLELGTSLGISTRYFADALPDGQVITIEGAPALASFSRGNFTAEGYKNVNLKDGDFSAVLPEVLPGLKGKKLIYLDGNHRYAPTIEYFHQILRYLGEEDILVFDDVHWSLEMEKAWEEIKNHQQVCCTIDVFFIGIVFFRKEFKEKCNFSIRF